jgi:hypothetical protein
MAKLYSLRDSLQTKEIFDEQSHLYLILDAQNTVKQKLNKIMYPDGVPATIQKFK